MGKLNEIQKQMTQSYGDNAFTTTIKDDTVEFDSLKDKFTFKDEVEVPSLKVNGEPITPSEPQKQADWNQNDSAATDYIKNRICYEETVGREYYNQSEGYETVEIVAFGQFEKYDAITLALFINRTLSVNIGGISMTLNTSNYIEAESGVYIVSGVGEAAELPFAILSTNSQSEITGGVGLYMFSNLQGTVVNYNLSPSNYVHQINEKYIPFEKNVVSFVEAPIKNNCFLYEGIEFTDDDEMIVDFTGIQIGEFGKCCGIFTAPSTSIDAVDTDGESIFVTSNLSALESGEDYMFECTLVPVPGMTSRIFITLNKVL